MEQKQAIADRLKQSNNILVTVSNNPSVDQLASCIGLTLALNKLGKHATAVFSGNVPNTIEFLQPEKTIEKNTDSLRDFIIALDKAKADKLRYKVEDTRVGQRTNYDKLILEIWTNGTVSPEMSLVEAAKILRKHLNPFINYREPGPELPIDERADAAVSVDGVDTELERKLNMSLAELELSVRATNCLESEGITTVRDLVIRTDEELLEVRNFGETTLKEVKQKLEERGLRLGMKLPSSVRR